MLEHLHEYSTSAAEAVARREVVGNELVRRCVIQAKTDGAQLQGASSEELAEIKELEAEVRRLEEDIEILRRASIFFRVNAKLILFSGVRSFLRCPGLYLVAFPAMCGPAGRALSSDVA